MKIIFNQKIASVLIFAVLFLSATSVSAFSLLSDKTRGDLYNQENTMRQQAGFEATNQEGVAVIVATVIKAFLGLLGVIFVVLVVYAGYNWMTAGGDEGKVTKSKQTLSRAVIGLIIVVAAYSITYFVFSNLDTVIDSGGGMTGS